jgi:hypothetical protein
VPFGIVLWTDALISVRPLAAPWGPAWWGRPVRSRERYRATVTDRASQPLLFLDVDGPLLPFGGSQQREARPGDAAPHLAQLHVEAGPRLARLSCTLVWATTWLQDANTEIAPRLGLPDLPVVTWPEPTPEQEREDRWFGLCWKTRTLVSWAAGRPFAWVDDEISDADRDWVSGNHPGPALLRSVDASRGLLDVDLAALEAWLAGIPRSPASGDYPV